VTPDQIAREIERCDREAAAAERHLRAGERNEECLLQWLQDWHWEKRLLESMLVEESDESYDASEALLAMRLGLA
jgi:hypothetical protein